MAKVEKKAAAVVEAVKETVVETVKETTKKAPAKKTAAKKTTTKTTAKKAESKATLYVQYAGKEFTTEEIVKICKEAATASLGKKKTSVIENIDIYVKPEEHAAYYVANGSVEGRVDL